MDTLNHPKRGEISNGVSKIFLILIMGVGLIAIILGGMSLLNFNLASLYGVLTATVTINPLEVEVSAPSEVEINKVFQVEAKVINKGEEKIENGKAEIILPEEGLVLLKKVSVQEIGVIPGKREKKISWQVRGEELSNYVILVKASGELRGEIVVAEGTASGEVVESLPRGRSWFQTLFDFFQGWF